MKLFSLTADTFKLDGGASFGTVPKTIWQNFVPVDENNMIPVISRCLLIETSDRLILIDAGMGDKQGEKYFKHFYRFGTHSLTDQIQKLGYAPEMLTDVILTHLHFDHCGGAFYYDEDGTSLLPRFPNANYICSHQQWDNACHPNPREKAAYFPENFLPMERSGKLHRIKDQLSFSPEIELRLFSGHTPGQIIPIIRYREHSLVYTADFIPSVFNIPLGYIAAFDTQPLLAMQEKADFLAEACENQYVLYFEHDYLNECCDLTQTEKGVRLGSVFTLDSLLDE